MDENLKIVEFNAYCNSCKYRNNSEEKFPCDECLNISSREDSRRPEYYMRNEE